MAPMGWSPRSPPRTSAMADSPPTGRDRPHRPPRRPRRRPVACAGPAPAPPTACAPPRRPTPPPASAPRALAPRARQAARPDARRRDEGRPGPLHHRLHRDPRVRARGVQGDARRAARRRRRRCRSRRSASCWRRSSAASVSDHFADLRGGGVRRRLDRPGPPRGHARRAPTWRSRSSTPASPRRSRPTCATSRCCCRSSSASRPGSTSRRCTAELRERIAEELDYEIEAQNHRAVERAWRGHPFVFVPRVDTGLSSRRVLVTDLLLRPALRARSRRSTRPSATASARSSSASTSRCCARLRRVCGDPHPGNYLLLDDGRVGFLDFGLMRTLDAGVPRGRAGAGARRRRRGRRRGPRDPRAPRLSA